MSHSNSAICAVENFLSDDSFRQYNVMLAKNLGKIEYAVLLQDMITQYKHFRNAGQLISHLTHGDGLMYYTIEKAYERTGIKKDSFNSAIKLFTKLGFFSKICKFGIPEKYYYILDHQAIYGYINSNNNYKQRKSSVHTAEIRSTVCGIPPGDKKAIKEIYLRNIDIDSASASPSNLKENVALFHPKDYILADGKKLKPITINALIKKMKDPRKNEIILRNVEWYENQIAMGIKPRKGHEVYLQFAISNDMGGKANNKTQNELYARYASTEKNIKIEILKTVVRVKKKSGQSESIGLELPNITFCQILDKCIED